MITGKLKFTSNKLDVTDPCYDKGVCCRMTVDIVPGVYKYEVITEITDGWGQRCRYISIIRDDAGPTRRGLRIGVIGVDAGLAGFFENKPDYDDDTWYKICRYLYKEDDGGPRVAATNNDNEKLFGCECVFCSSGYGDGSYDVRQLLDLRDQVVGYEIKFF